MTNDEFQMTKETGNPKHEESSLHLPRAIRSFELCHSFDIRHSDFGIIQSLLTSAATNL